MNRKSRVRMKSLLRVVLSLLVSWIVASLATIHLCFTLEEFRQPASEGDYTFRPSQNETRQNNVVTKEGMKRQDECDESARQCCWTWDYNTDEWWTHHPDWQISYQTRSKLCFSKIADKKKAAFFWSLYETQWHSDCSKSFQRTFINSGYGASINWMVDGFLSARGEGRPFQVTKQYNNSRWMFAGGTVLPHQKFTADPVCPAADQTCYFLKLSNCEPTTGQSDRPNATFTIRDGQERRWIKQYLARPQQWLRKRVFDYILSHGPTYFQGPCTVMHVRRTDVVLDQGGGKNRNYLPLGMYLDHGKISKGSNILLLTDDQSTIDEAHKYHSKYNWMYVNRTRFFGAEGGMNNHLPSGDGITEVVAILAELELVKRCDTFVYSKSGFTRLIKDELDETVQVYTDIQIDSHLRQRGKMAVKSDADFFTENQLDRPINGHPLR